MNILLILLVVAFVEIQSKELDHRPRTALLTAGKSVQSSTPQNRKRQATKEVILYLTPSQIKALQSGETALSSFLPKAAITDQDSQKQITTDKNDSILRKQFENIKAGTRFFIPVHESQQEDLESASENPTFKQEEQQTENENRFQKFDYGDPLRQHTALHKFHLQGPEQWNTYKPDIERDAWIDYDYTDKKEEESFARFKQKWDKILELNRKQLKALSEQAAETQNPEKSIPEENTLLQLQYGAKYNDQKNAIEIEKLIRERHQDQLNKQSALVRAEAIANSPPILIHEEVRVTKHRPIPVFRREPLSPPESVPIYESLNVNIPNTYNIPLSPLQIKQFPLRREEGIIDDQRQFPVSWIKQGTSIKRNRPFIVQKNVPYSIDTNNVKNVELPTYKTEKVSILRPVWNN